MKRIFFAIIFFTILCPSLGVSQTYRDYKNERFPALAIPYTFTGYFLGANVGWKFGSYAMSYESDSYTDSSDEIILPQSFDFDVNENSFTYGGQVGYNYQHKTFLIGLVADWTGMSLGTTQIAAETDSPVFEEGDKFTTSSRWESSYRLRLGYVWNNWLWYATTGVSRVNFQVKADLIPPTPDASDLEESDNKTITGGTVGLGTEYAVNPKGDIGIAFNTEVMKRAWMRSDQNEIIVKIG